MLLFSALLRPLIRKGRLTVIDPDGRSRVFAGEPGPAITIRLHERSLARRLGLNPELCAGEAYTDGTLTVEDGSIYDFLDLIGGNLAAARRTSVNGPLRHFRRWLRTLRQFNPVPRARRNVAHHYDLSATLYELFLDRDLQYSCAYFLDPHDSLEAAQHNKKEHIAAKLRLDRGMRVLDIGCGWGGLALFLADQADVRVTGITLSEEQIKVAQRRAEQAGLASRAEFHLRDYRQEGGTYDRIVSVGMFEHVGVTHYDTFFRVIADRLADDGVALLHTIGRAAPPGGTNPWIQKYIFPGGYTPSLSEVVRAIERSGLLITDVEVLRLHYAETLRRWRDNFQRNRDRVAALYDERFCRMWEFYLAACEITFRYLNSVVFQIQLAKRCDTLPLVRDYMVDAERARRPAHQWAGVDAGADADQAA
jgi:cyclopropane-fatty-acyl-phospholipid synthase